MTKSLGNLDLWELFLSMEKVNFGKVADLNRSEYRGELFLEWMRLILRELWFWRSLPK